MSERPQPRPAARLLERLEPRILYEDDRLLVLNKPSGLAVHGGSGIHFGVIEALRLLRPDQRQLELVHRLDRDTSGCLLIAKRRSALRTLHELLRNNRVDKRYLALLTGHWSQDRVEVNAPLRKNTLKSGERIVRVDPLGKPALTRFQIRQRFADSMLAAVKLLTGRTHQIRVHAAYQGSPILGDEKYGDELANRKMRNLGVKRLFLHAESIGFHWPGEGRELIVKAPLDAELEALLKRLKAGERLTV
jgi:23S rRNA pseudouridine955/2504/2580 synthase